MKKNFFYILFSILLSPLFVDGQGEINLLNGKTIEFDSIGKASNKRFDYVSHLSHKHCKVRQSRVFNITYKDGKEEVFYTMDSLNNVFTLPQMREYVKGEQDSKKYYKPKLATIGGLVAGGISGYFGVFYGPFVPALYATLIAASPPPDISTKSYADKTQINSDYYAYGFENASRKKKFKNAILSGGIGFGVSVTSFIILRQRH